LEKHNLEQNRTEQNRTDKEYSFLVKNYKNIKTRPLYCGVHKLVRRPYSGLFLFKSFFEVALKVYIADFSYIKGEME